jgi:hypothetical protein
MTIGMAVDSIDTLKREGFEGFEKIDTLIDDIDDVSDQRGIYVVLYRGNCRPGFLEKGTGGWFDGKDPNYDLKTVRDRWVDGAIVVYIGKTDRPLKTRILEFLKFGLGQDIGHRGGRLVWQILNRENLVLCWKSTKDDSKSPREIERNMIAGFEAIHGKKPFANINP